MDITPLHGNALSELGLGYSAGPRWSLGRWTIGRHESSPIVRARGLAGLGLMAHRSLARRRPRIRPTRDSLLRMHHEPSGLGPVEQAPLLLAAGAAGAGPARHAHDSTTASIIAALQVQELVKVLHGMKALMGQGLVFDGGAHSSYVVTYPLDPNCPWHEPPPSIIALKRFGSATTLQEIWDEAARRLGGVDALDLSRELVSQLVCGRAASASRFSSRSKK